MKGFFQLLAGAAVIGVAGPLAAGSMTRVMLRSGAEVRGEVLKEREEAVLLDLGYTDVTVLDISAHALERAKLRLGERAKAVTWIESDVTAFKPERQYDVWHDRAAFHFLRETEEINYYVSLLKEHVSAGGFVFIGTFSEQGPTKCSGIEIHQYNEQDLSGLIADKYHKIKCIYTDHLTPFNTIQSFIFCSFKHKPAA